MLEIPQLNLVNPVPVGGAAEDVPPIGVSLSLLEVEAAIVASGRTFDCPIFHRFTPGLYVREGHIPAGGLVLSAVHRTEHPFVISKGKVWVWSEESGTQALEAPFCGITKPGTKRMLYAETDTVWTTFHVTDETDVERIGEAILEPSANPFIEDQSALEMWRKSIPKIETL